MKYIVHFITQIGDCEIVSNPTSTRCVGMSETSSKDRKGQCQGPKHEFFSWSMYWERNPSCPNDQTMTLFISVLRDSSK